MTKNWSEHGCDEVKAHYTFYTVPVAAALWCGIPEDRVHEELERCVPVDDLGGAVLRHPDIKCIEYRCLAIHDAIRKRELPVARENGIRVNDHVTPARRHVYLLDLKIWMSEKFPTDKPPLLFDEIERSAHPHVTADTYRSVKADRDALKEKNSDLEDAVMRLKTESEALTIENKRLQEVVSKTQILDDRSRATYLNVIGALTSLIFGKNSLGAPNSLFRNQSALINALVENFGSVQGISKKNLEIKLLEAKNYLTSSE